MHLSVCVSVWEEGLMSSVYLKGVRKAGSFTFGFIFDFFFKQCVCSNFMMSKSNRKSSWTKASLKKLIYLFQLKCYLSAHQC